MSNIDKLLYIDGLGEITQNLNIGGNLNVANNINLIHNLNVNKINGYSNANNIEIGSYIDITGQYFNAHTIIANNYAVGGTNFISASRQGNFRDVEVKNTNNSDTILLTGDGGHISLEGTLSVDNINEKTSNGITINNVSIKNNNVTAHTISARNYAVDGTNFISASRQGNFRDVEVKNTNNSDTILLTGDGGHISLEGTLSVDNINEKTSNNGVTIEGVILKDNNLNVSGIGTITTLNSANITGNVTGNASTATTLQTVRTIGGVSFDGSANIDLSVSNGLISSTNNRTIEIAVSTSPTINISDTMTIYNGSGNSILRIESGNNDGYEPQLKFKNNGVDRAHIQFSTLDNKLDLISTKALHLKAYSNAGRITLENGFVDILASNNSIIRVDNTDINMNRDILASGRLNIGTATSFNSFDTILLEQSGLAQMTLSSTGSDTNDVPQINLNRTGVVRANLTLDSSNRLIINSTQSNRISINDVNIVNISNDNVEIDANLNVYGNLNVTGNINQINSEQINVLDKNIVLASNNNNDNYINDAGLILKSSTDKTFLYNSIDNSWESNINIKSDVTGNLTGNVTGNVTGNADTATKIASITNSNIVQLTNTQTLTNKTLTSPTITGSGSIAGVFAGNLTGNVNGDVTGDLTGNVTGNVTGDLTGNADTATKIASITNSDIVQLDTIQTLTNKTLTSPTITGTGSIAGVFTGNLTGNADTATKIASITNSNIVQLNTSQTLTNKTLTSPTITGTGSIAGVFTGNLTGNVTGNVTGNITSDTTISGLLSITKENTNNIRIDNNSGDIIYDVSNGNEHIFDINGNGIARFASTEFRIMNGATETASISNTGAATFTSLNVSTSGINNSTNLNLKVNNNNILSMYDDKVDIKKKTRITTGGGADLQIMAGTSTSHQPRIQFYQNNDEKGIMRYVPDGDIFEIRQLNTSTKLRLGTYGTNNEAIDIDNTKIEIYKELDLNNNILVFKNNNDYQYIRYYGTGMDGLEYHGYGTTSTSASHRFKCGSLGTAVLELFPDIAKIKKPLLIEPNSTYNDEFMLHIKSLEGESCKVCIECDFNNNGEDENPSLIFKQDGGNIDTELGLLNDNVGSINNNFYIHHTSAVGTTTEKNQWERIGFFTGASGTSNPRDTTNLRMSIENTRINMYKPLYMNSEGQSGSSTDRPLYLHTDENFYIKYLSDTTINGTDIAGFSGVRLSNTQRNTRQLQTYATDPPTNNTAGSVVVFNKLSVNRNNATLQGDGNDIFTVRNTGFCKSLIHSDNDTCELCFRTNNQQAVIKYYTNQTLQLQTGGEFRTDATSHNFFNSGTLRLAFQSDTNLVVYDGTTIKFASNDSQNAHSSRDYKKNINDLVESESINVIKNLNPVSFEYLEKYWNKHDRCNACNCNLRKGFIWEDTKPILPQATRTINMDNPDEETTKTLDLKMVIPDLTKTVQYLLNKVETQESTISTLTQQLTTQSTLISNLQSQIDSN